jgi:hypothetical protein
MSNGFTSAVDPTMPVTGGPTTASVRANFDTIKTEIEGAYASLGQHANGLLADWYGTGTDDDTALWTEILALCASLGIPRIYAACPSNVKSLRITQPIEIVGLPGFCFNLAATATTSDSVLMIECSNVTLRNFKVNLPRYNMRLSLAQPVCDFGILVESSPFSWAQSVPLSNIYLENISVTGGMTGISFIGGDRITIVNCEANGCYGHGLDVGTIPTTKVRIDGFRAVSCGGYAMSIGGDMPAGTPFNDGVQDIEIRDAYAIDCGKLCYWTGFDGGIKLGYDLTGNSMRRLHFEGVAVNCGFGGLENKFTTPPPSNVAPATVEECYIDITVIQDCLVGGGGNGVILTAEDLTCPEGALKKIYLKTHVLYKGPVNWAAGHFYDVGDGIANGSNVYMCVGDANGAPGMSGALGPPTGTGTASACFFDGTLYWWYLSNASSAIPAPGFVGVMVESSGDANSGITLDCRVENCGYGIGLYPNQTLDTAIRNLHIRSPIITNCIYGIFDGGNQAGTTPGIINVLITNPVIQANAASGAYCVGVQLGNSGNGSTTGATNVTAAIIGGRVSTTGNGTAFNAALRLNGGTVALTLSGDPNFVTDGPDVFYAQNCAITVNVMDATFQSTAAAGRPVASTSAVTGSWNNYGSVKFLQPDNTVQGYSMPGVTFQGAVIRGLATAAPSAPGNLGETWKLCPETPTIGRYVCTTAGGSAGATTWTPKI